MADGPARPAGADGGVDERGRRIRLAVVAGVLLVAAVLSLATYRATTDGGTRVSPGRLGHPTGAFGGGGTGDTFTVSGSVTTPASDLGGDDPAGVVCVDGGDGTLSSQPDQPDVQVLVRGPDGKVVGLARLAAAQFAGLTCTRAFSVTGVPAGLRFYSVQLTGQAARWYPEADVHQFLALGVQQP